jgi:TolA-binding protein
MITCITEAALSWMRLRHHDTAAACRYSLRAFLLLGLAYALLVPCHASASVPNTLYRIDIRPKKDFTRITIKLGSPSIYSVSPLPGNRLRVSISDTGGTLFKKYRKYSDSNIGGLILSRRGDQMLVTFQMATGAAWRDVTSERVSAITLEVGKKINRPAGISYLPGREKIWNGVEKLVRDFDPPIKSDIVFLPTDRQVLKTLLDEEGTQAFVAAEAALYKGYLTDAEDAFTAFAAKPGAIRSLALYRLGETCYKLQKYPQALSAFREAEKLWAEFLNFNPGVTFYYGDSIARSGDLAAARSMLSGLIARLSDKKYAPVLLVRLADILTRQGHASEALAIYMTAAENFKDNKANMMARLRLADREFMSATPWSFSALSQQYQDISLRSSDIDLREESQFKHMLLESIHGDSAGALRLVMQFQKKFPRGPYSTVCKTIREVLVGAAYRQGSWDKDPAGLIRFMEEHQEYLSGCIEAEDFLVKAKKAYEEAGRPIELVKFFSFLLERQWAAAGAPFMYEVVADNSELLGDNVLAEKSFRAFLQKYPAHPRARFIWERLGALYFNEGRLPDTRNALAWILNKGESARFADSYYYLGKALLLSNSNASAVKSMDLYFARPERSERLQPDAYVVAASAYEANGDRKGALRLLEAAVKLPPNARTDELLYKAGTISRQEGRADQAREYFNQLLKTSKDQDWQKLASRALESLGDKSAP